MKASRDQATPGPDVIDVYPFTDPYHATVDGGGGIDLVNIFAEYGMSVTLDFNKSAIPQTIIWPDGGTTTIVNVERVNLHINAGYAPTLIHITGGAYSDTLNGGPGGDYLAGGGGNDLLNGGDPTVYGSGSDTVFGGAGDDTFINIGTAAGVSSYRGGTGRDVFVLGQYSAFYEGRVIYNDVITDFTPGAQGDLLQWGTPYEQDYWSGKLRVLQDGPHVIVQELLEGPATDSHVVSYDYAWNTLVTLENVTLAALTPANFGQPVGVWGGYDDVVRGTDDADLINGGFGDDDLLGRAGHDTLNGAQGRDTLKGVDGNDTITGGYGDDLIFGGAGDDRILAGFENDKVFGDAGDDRITGDQGDDTLAGGAGDDHLDGGRGQDRLYGNAGNDTLVSGSGHDVMRGDEGRDVFVIASALYGQWDRNIVLDFTLGDDRLDLRTLGLHSFDEIAPLLEDDINGNATLFVWDAEGYFGPAERVTLLGVHAAELSARDFVLG